MSNYKGHSNFNMSNRLTPEVENMMARECPSSILVYNTLISVADNYNVCEPTEKSIAEKLHYSSRTVARALRYMNKKGIIRIVHVEHTKYFVLNTLAFFHYIAADESKKIAGELRFITPAEICKRDNPKFFHDYYKFLGKARARKNSSRLSSRSVIHAYAKQNHTLPKVKKLNANNIALIKKYLINRVKSLCRSKLYEKVGIYLVNKLPVYNGRTLNITNAEVSHVFNGQIGNTTVFKAISFFSQSGMLLHLRGKMAITPGLLLRAKRNVSRSLQIKRLSQQLRDAKMKNRNTENKLVNKKQLQNRH